jgi:hypothetical protein
MTAFYMFRLMLTFFQNLEEPQNKTPFARKSFFDYHSFDCLAILATIGGMIEFGNSWLNH